MLTDVVNAQRGSTKGAGTQQLTVTTVGTCRIADPIAAAARVLPMQRDLTNLYGFVHTTKEILQQLDFFGGREIPGELVRFIASADYSAHRERQASDLYLVEVSSLKEIHFGDYLLQINCLDRVFAARRELLETFFRHKYATERDIRAKQLEAHESFASADPVERDVLLNAYMHLTTREELEADLARIVSRIPGPLVFVSHIDVPDGAGRPIETRSRLCRWMREICEERGYPFFDPTPQVVAYDRVRALAEEGRDNNHYTPEFKTVLGSLLYETYGLPLIEARGAPGLPPSAGQAHGSGARVAAGEPVRPPVAPDVRTLVQEARERVARGELDEAEVALRTAAMDFPGSADLHSLLATVAFQRGENTSALAELREALRIDPALLEPKVMLVRIASRLNRLEEACAGAVDIVGAPAADHKALSVAAKALAKAKRFHEAAPVWRRVAAMRPEEAEPLVEAARCELKARDFERAIGTAGEALGRDVRSAGALHVKIEAYQRLRRPKEMGAAAVEMAALDAAAALATIPVLVAASHLEEAAAVLAAARRQGHPGAEDRVMQAGLVRSLTKKARLAMDRHEAAAAAAAWHAVALVDPGNKNAASGMRKIVAPILAEHRASIRAGDAAAALAACERGLALAPRHPRLLKEHAALAERRADWAVAARSWEALADAADADPKPLIRAARAAARAGQPSEALRLYGRLDPALRAEMGSTLASLIRKIVHAMRADHAAGDTDGAVAKARQVQAIQPENEAAARLLRKAISGYRLRMKEAVGQDDVLAQEGFARRILAIDPRRLDALKVLSRVLRNARRWPEAVEAQELLVRMEPNEVTHWRRLASACRSARLYDRGVTAAMRAAELAPGDRKTLDFLSDMLNRQALAA
ncbi:tetratricopeptide repeat protein [Roseomonas sp. CCTCC AB2023176]|uniref:tetratricopeptide repeat protein n=1 Tax=Roseomonas sp. CCTCC AB2023176 TaxID=3342640 RepID=UPI0035DC3E4C